MTQSAGTAEPREPLWTPVFTRFFVARAVDLAGTSMTPVALTLSVLQATGSAGSVGAVMTASLAPMLLLMLLGGVTADRLERLTIIRVTAAASTLTLGAMALTLRAGPQLWILMSLSAVSGLLSAFSGPALRSVIAELAPRSRLQEANAVLASARHAAKIVGPALAGLLVATVGGFWALAIDALSYAVVTILLPRHAAGTARTDRAATAPPSPGARTRAPRRSPVADLAEGWRTFVSLRWVWVCSLCFALINLLSVGPWQVLGPALVSQDTGIGAWGGVESARAAGLLLASLVLTRVTLRRPLLQGRALGALYGCGLLALGLTGQAAWAAAGAAVGAIGMVASGITYDATLQTAVPRDRLGRVVAIDELVSYVMIPLSTALAAPLASLVGTQALVTTCGAGVAAASLLPVASRTVRSVDL